MSKFRILTDGQSFWPDIVCNSGFSISKSIKKLGMVISDIIMFIFVLVGAIMLFASLFLSMKILVFQSTKTLKRSWYTITILQVIFVFCYIGALYVFGSHNTDGIKYLASAVFFGGGVFVFIIIRASLVSMNAMQKTNSQKDKMGKNIAWARVTMQGNVKLIQSLLSEMRNITSSLASVSSETLPSITEFSSSIDKIYQKSEISSKTSRLHKDELQNLHKYGDRAKVLLEDGEEVFQNLFSTSSQLKDSSRSVDKSVHEAGDHIQEIGTYINNLSRIVSIISDISDQTNLLALNASIEAARAGKHGKGFAIVAKEINKLAENSSKNAEEINQILAQSEKILLNGKKAVRSTREMVRLQDKEYQNLNKLMRTYKELTNEQQDTLRSFLQVFKKTEDFSLIISDIAQEQFSSMQSASELASSIILVIQNVKEQSKKLQQELEQVGYKFLDNDQIVMKF